MFDYVRSGIRRQEDQKESILQTEQTLNVHTFKQTN